MTQPSVNMTFDTSLIDTHNPTPSFSTTESDLSEVAATSTRNPSEQLDVTPTPPLKASTPVQHVATQDAYDQWASVYDNDGNMLQAIDDLELSTLLPEFLNLVTSATATRNPKPLSLIDLGCGTGRTTAKLLAHPWIQLVSVTAVDFSAPMLAIAERKLAPLLAGRENVRLSLSRADCFPTTASSTASPVPDVGGLRAGAADGLVSTLVLEHVSLKDYFATVAALVRPGGYALITNMHDEMGRVSQAGFVNAQGVKVRGQSFAYTVEGTVGAAREVGFEVVQVKERAVTKEDVESGSVGERGKKWVGVRVWYGVVLRMREMWERCEDYLV
ncbi:S-adenosyl-L-methionine-dependent methyltransferase [Bimuria novae-zelandiae CBS 107.79]|uniref:S-adenosyl-L-methionine-dependent methyltransferase n=1 Tax=Bimuria novae-zelandiae CBS 107.79 TaxID=1447943 RepID=A0A6A5V9A0_9PLEO|nr:S-adenosyl-L-methionine-dependent methyltransferase [Bimuria novae-zelandiae CBS 107.79]